MSADQFASYYALGRPFLIAFINTDRLSSDKSSLMPVMEKLAKSGGPFDEQIVCAWMDVYVGIFVLFHMRCSHCELVDEVSK